MDYLQVTDCSTDPGATDWRLAAANLAAARKQRSRSLPGDFLGEPAWDILLELFSRSSAQSMKSISIGAGVPLTTTLRWIALLDQQGVVYQFPDPRDARRTMVRLTPQGEARVAEAVKGVCAAMQGLPDEV